ncbi:MAG: tRNA epoxyqueuosine(34) reductase QueG, partial [Alcanivorax sp.]|nr:tRNA epoxyqueuosine(34) reductase QueG [Alcanivorax sp.]
GHEGWLRNLAVGLGNGPASEVAITALQARLDFPSAMVVRHVRWALERLQRQAGNNSSSDRASST